MSLKLVGTRSQKILLTLLIIVSISCMLFFISISNWILILAFIVVSLPIIYLCFLQQQQIKAQAEQLADYQKREVEYILHAEQSYLILHELRAIICIIILGIYMLEKMNHSPNQSHIMRLQHGVDLMNQKMSKMDDVLRNMIVIKIENVHSTPSP